MNNDIRDIERDITALQTNYTHTTKDIEEIKKMLKELIQDDSFKMQINNIQQTLENINKHTDPINHKQQTIDELMSYLNTNEGMVFIARLVSIDDKFKKLRKEEIIDQTKNNKLGVYDRITTIIIGMISGIITSYILFFIKGN